MAVLVQDKAAARGGKLRDLPKMGAKSEQNIITGIESLALNAHNGAITARLDGRFAQGRYAGQHLVWAPEFRTRKGETQLRKWRCGSPDIAERERPFGCRDDMRVLAPAGG